MEHEASSPLPPLLMLIIRWFLPFLLEKTRYFPTLIRGEGGYTIQLKCPNYFWPGLQMMRYFWASDIFGTKAYFKSWRAPGNLFVSNKLQKRSNSIPRIGQKNIFFWSIGEVVQLGYSVCLPFARKNRLVDSRCKWDASNPKWKFPRRCARSISTAFSRKIRSKASQFKRPGTVKTSKWNVHFPFGNSVWEILVYFSRNPVFPSKLPFGETKLLFPFTIHPKFPNF